MATPQQDSLNEAGTSQNLIASPPTMRGFGDIELGNTSAVGENRERYMKIPPPPVNAELAELEEIHRLLREANKNSKSLDQSSADVSAALTKAKQLKATLVILHTLRNGEVKLPATERTPTSVVAEQRLKLKESMETLESLRLHISSTYSLRYFIVTGNTPEEAVLDDFISSGEAERFLEQQGGGGEVMEMRQRLDAVKEIEKNLLALHQLFLYMAGLVDAEAKQQTNMARANSFKCAWVAIFILLLVVLLVVFSALLGTGVFWRSTRRRR